jgi:hypothetical protein
VPTLSNIAQAMVPMTPTLTDVIAPAPEGLAVEVVAAPPLELGLELFEDEPVDAEPPLRPLRTGSLAYETDTPVPFLQPPEPAAGPAPETKLTTAH